MQSTFGDFLPNSVAPSIANINQYPFLFLQAHRKDYYTASQEAYRTNHEEDNPLVRAFMCEKNMKRIQLLLIKRVFVETKGKIIIPPQSETDVYLIMRAIYTQYARHLPCNLKEQIQILNKATIEESIGGVMTGIKQKLLYYRDISTNLDPPDRPVNLSKKGTRTLPSVTTTFGINDYSTPQSFSS